MTDTLLKQLEELLDQEKASLLNGEVESVAALEEQKQTLVGRLGDQSLPDVEIMSRLRHKLQRNEALMAAARNGLRSASERLRSIRKAAKGLDTYTRNGGLQSLGGDGPKIEHKA